MWALISLHAQRIRSLFEERGYHADVIHSKLDPDKQEEIIRDLKNGTLDCIVQVQMLGEGFDHSKLSVAAIFRPFRSLGPYIQFVGRILRVVVQNDPTHPDNYGHIVTHVGLNLDEQLKKFKTRKQAGLIVCSGRRRVGKSTLIVKFAEYENFAEFYGLPPHKTSSRRDQLDNFSKLLSEQFSTPYVQFSDWHDALSMLASLSGKDRIILLLDEISWMASNDKNFAGILKGLWDTKFKKNNRLILVLCGSVSSWIDLISGTKVGLSPYLTTG